MSASTPTQAPQPQPSRKARRRETAKLVGGLVLGGLIVAFALLNFDKVSVNWILGTWSTPLIVVIIASALVGAAIDRVAVVRRRKRR